ncbi:type IV toxin-antitoxin system AbiEi family antitoxin domain-containing protein [Quadrisphaera sp. DSM 44207]|uniref:type IV toxin-antitoxin system AbiEi family antitoxin domain-containing protein n=1 Tax=Quadrisphaera sp. DSM 44207 TaxID=1881057 RepID=UPI00087FF69F|nr:type IV toxin-antitoxin system AbiEi family antitoxin domain-containing protein [Quadrisphaera sp. DSM 44207]SDQ65129.1 Transcriptional regulator, AbiEi antitoxin, Type IV TA system [Quadrisphaera sp. DSM 44207]
MPAPLLLLPPSHPPQVPAALAALAAEQDAVVTAAQARAAGVAPHVVRSLVAQGEWTVPLRGAYLTDPLRAGRDLARSWARAASMAVPGAVIGLGSAAVLHGVDGVPRRGAVQVVVQRGAEKARRRFLEPHAFLLGAGDVVDLGGIPATGVVRTLADLVPRLERPDALAVLDSALRRGLVDRAGLLRAADGSRRRPGCRRAADLWALADPRAESPLESRARLRCIEDDLAPDDLQVEVRDERGHLVARADMVFRRRTRPGALPLLLEADGRGPHDLPEAVHRDRWRANALVALGYDVLRCTWADTTSPLRIPTMVRAAL